MTITIKDGPDVPVQVDGEAWMQKPGVIKIEHKAREYKLLKAWVENICVERMFKKQLRWSILAMFAI